ncbi:TetR/AcrR family transcriptional regulator [Amnibacterium setariae]|uniref:TetR/AcrR family transcriptional regulator n=1 Tax=Amnibacterium setariae TaxID=2306585 RepID=A0A3A1U3Y2_9MICO|nr:TetR/AcrR family transcriptional regulator [Amnibacterium setariae]RIX31082.1 TetR/AcrR family transcriptional regulator [Amnibacterium setariae]
MPPRPAPDLDVRRDLITRTAWRIAETEGWPAVTMRRIAGELGVTQPVLYTAFAGRQALIDAVALAGFGALAEALEATDADLRPRMQAYLDFAAAHPAIYAAMFSMPSDLRFGASTQESLLHAFTAVRDAVPDADDTRAELAWATLHGLATLGASGRLPLDRAQARLERAHEQLSR